MVESYVGEIRIFAGSFAPAGWRFCDGTLLAISEYEKLFNLIGTTYGGDGQNTFALPDLRGRIPLHQGNGVNLAETGGAEEVTLTVNQIPAHTHPLLVTAAGADSTNAKDNVLAKASQQMYDVGPGPNPMNPQSVGPTGGSQPDKNFQPYLCLDFIISLFGIYPSQT